MKGPVFHPKPEKLNTGREEVDLWDAHYNSLSVQDVNSISTGEVWRILDRAEVLHGSILEAGCGHGVWVRALSQRGYTVHGFDFSLVGLHLVKDSSPYVPIVCADIRKLPYRSETFDTILSWGVVEHLPEGPEAALREMRRCLRKSGVMAISVPMLSFNRLMNPVILARRLASRSNWLRKFFGKGEKSFFNGSSQLGLLLSD